MENKAVEELGPSASAKQAYDQSFPEDIVDPEEEDQTVMCHKPKIK